VTIAVLPFEPINAANRDELYDVGIADALINRLSTVENLQVRSLSSVKRYVDREKDAVDAGIEQRVEYVLASRYQLVGGKIRITAQLINVGSAKTVETYDFQKDATDTFTAQDAVALELKDRLAAKFGDRGSDASSARGTNNAEAYRYYLLAQNFNELRGPENGRIALEQINQAVALDPNFARAWATKAYIHRYMGYGSAAIEHSLKSMEAVEKALALDPNLSEAHSTLCFNKFRFEYDFDGAESSCRRAIELDPNSALAHKLYSNFLYTRGRFDESFAEIQKAIELQPVSYENHQPYALALYFARRYSESETQWKQLIPLNPNHNLIYAHLVRSLVQQGKEAEALEPMIKLLSLEKADGETIMRFRDAFARSGWRGVEVERIKLIESRENPASFELARLYASIGDNDNAFKYLEQAHRERSNMIAVLGVDPELDSLRADARYTELLRRIDEKNRP
jgi:TolB-like protein/Tfp pilus assembly protein PilF